MSERYKGRRINPESAKRGGLKRRYGGNGRAKPIFCVELNIKFSCIKEAAEKLSFRESSLYNCLKRGNRLNGYHFKYIKEEK